MSRYRRAFRPGGTFFFTLVTDGRAPILHTDPARALLREAFAACRAVRPFEVPAIVLLPDHLHLIMKLPEGDDDFSSRLSMIKAHFTRGHLECGGREQHRSPSRRRQGYRGVWQRRFWEHAIRDQADYNSHLNYIHYNPVKHGHCACPHDWPHSSFHRWCETGHYRREWCCVCDGSSIEPPVFSGLDEAAME